MTHACTFCRSRKIKCDRNLPCSSCLRLKNSNCEYVTAVTKRKRKNLNPANKFQSEIDNLKQQLRQIEKNRIDYVPRETMFIQDDDSISMSSKESFSMSQVDDYDYGEYSELLGLVNDNNNEEISIFGTNSVLIVGKVGRRNFGIFSWKAYSLIDPGLSVVTKYLKRKMFEDADLKHTSKCNNLSDIVKPITDLNSKLSISDNDLSFGGHRELGQDDTSEASKFNIRHFKPLSGLKMGRMSPKSLYEYIMELKKNIEEVMPPKNVVWRLLDVFFSKLYILVPIIDETDLKGDLLRLFEGTPPDQKCKDLKIYNKLDFAILGTTLLILRLSYLSLLPIPWKKGEMSEDTKEQVLNHPISLEAVAVANDCVDVFNLFGPISLAVFQLVFITRIYSIYGPEAGDGIDHGEGPLLNSMLFQFAFNMGLHRDPENTPGVPDERNKNLIRKMWATLRVLDLGYTLEYGDPLNVCRFSYDTKPPIFSNAGSNLIDIEQEKEVMECYQVLDSYHLLIDFLKDFLRVDKKVNVLDLVRHLKILRGKIFNSKSVADLSDTFLMTLATPSMINVCRTRIQLQFTYFIFSVHYHLFLHYEKLHQYDLAFYFLKVMLRKTFVFLMPFLFKLFDSQSIEPVVEFVLVPGIQSMVHKSTMILSAIMIRVKYQLNRLKENKNHANLLKEDIAYQIKFNNLTVSLTLMNKLWEYLFKITSSYSTRYLFSWIVSRLNKVKNQTIMGDEFDDIFSSEQPTFPIFSDDQKVVELIKVMELALELRDRSMRGLSNENILNNELKKALKKATSNYSKTPPSSTDSPFNLFGSSKTGNMSPSANQDLFDQQESIDSIWMDLLKGTSTQADIPQVNNMFNQFNGVNNNGTMDNNQPNFNQLVDSFFIDEVFRGI